MHRQINSTTSRQLMEFRNYVGRVVARVAAFDVYVQMFSRTYIDSNAGRFLEND
jgi:hypothetical protein